LYKRQIIQKITASVLLIVLALSITPAIVFHNWLVNHTDTYKKNVDAKAQQFGKQTFNCHCDHIVAESPFTLAETCKNLLSFQIFEVSQTIDITNLPAAPAIFLSLRGPPVF
jgi:uncharacterized membrane protein